MRFWVSWVHVMRFCLFPSPQTSSKILNSVVQNHLVLFTDKAKKGFKQIYRAFKSTAKEYRGKVGIQCFSEVYGLIVYFTSLWSCTGKMNTILPKKKKSSHLVFSWWIDVTPKPLHRFPASWDLVSLKAIAYNLVNFYTHQSVQGALIPCGPRKHHTGSDNSNQCVMICSDSVIPDTPGIME